MKILFMSQMPPHSNQSGNSSVEQLRQQLNEQQNNSNATAISSTNASSTGYLTSTTTTSAAVDLLYNSSFLPANNITQVDDEQSVLLENLLMMSEFELADDDPLLNGADFKFEIMDMTSMPLDDMMGGEETTTLINAAMNPSSLTNVPASQQYSTVPSAVQPMNNGYAPNTSYTAPNAGNMSNNTTMNINNTNVVSTAPDSFRRMAANTHNYFGNTAANNNNHAGGGMLSSSGNNSMTNATTTSNNHLHSENQQRMTSAVPNFLDTKHIKQEYYHHEDSNSSSATYKSEPAISTTMSSKAYYDPNPASVSSSNNGDVTFTRYVEPTTSGLAQRRSHNKKQQSEEITYGPITVRPRKNPAPTLASGRRSKSIILSDDEARKREVRRQRNRNAAEKCKQKRTQIEDTLNSDVKRLRDEHAAWSQENEKLTAIKRRLVEIWEAHSRTCSGAVRAATSQPAAAYQTQPQPNRMTKTVSPVMNAPAPPSAYEPVPHQQQQRVDTNYQPTYNTVPQSVNNMYQHPSQAQAAQNTYNNMMMTPNGGYLSNNSINEMMNPTTHLNQHQQQQQQQQPQQQLYQPAYGYNQPPAYVQQQQQQPNNTQQQPQIAYHQQPPNQIYPPQYN